MPQASMVMEKAVGMVIFSVPACPPGCAIKIDSATCIALLLNETCSARKQGETLHPTPLHVKGKQL